MQVFFTALMWVEWGNAQIDGRHSKNVEKERSNTAEIWGSVHVLDISDRKYWLAKKWIPSPWTIIANEFWNSMTLEPIINQPSSISSELLRLPLAIVQDPVNEAYSKSSCKNHHSQFMDENIPASILDTLRYSNVASCKIHYHKKSFSH